ncbi:shufflon system plasmid conjugative transfer pilus tip adhesin PilV, partial [Plesiomonas sp. ZOR0011]|uniref:shufflon system plasmid conjugative transfer pilus tip adhesin PilV n=1 Tax=Plesiomonas sp. ZOR0011 TaxID=1339230 RepID=UPI0012E071E1
MKTMKRGFTLIEVLVTIAILAILIPQGLNYFNLYLNQQVTQIAAQHQKSVQTAAAKYVEMHYAQLLAGTLPRVINIDELRGNGLLNQDWFKCGDVPCHSGNAIGQGVLLNPFSQKYKMVIRSYPLGGKTILDALLLTEGGQKIPIGDLVSISRAVGAAGGYTEAGKAIGTFNLWETTLSAFGGGANVGDGHLASALIVADGASRSNDFLYRSAVPGKPELNRMNTDLDLGGNSIRGVNSISATGPLSAGDIDVGSINSKGNISGVNIASQGSVTAGGDVSSSGAVTANSDIRTNSGWLITQGNQGWRNTTHNGGWYMSDSTWVRSYLDKNIYTGGQVLAGNISSNGRLRTGEYLLIEGIAVAGQNCSPNGLEGRDTTGAPLICQSG